MTFGLLASLTAVGIVVLAAPYLLRPTTGRAVDVADRFALSILVAVVAMRLATRAAASSGNTIVPGGIAADTGFWVAAAGTSMLYAASAERRAFVATTARLADAVSWMLLVYGAYLSLCVLRSACSSIGGVSGPGLTAEVAVGVGLAVSAVVLHRSWSLGDRQRVAIAVGLAAAVRMVLASIHVPVGGRPVSSLALALVLVGEGALFAVRASRSGGSKSPLRDALRSGPAPPPPSSGPGPNNDTV